MIWVIRIKGRGDKSGGGAEGCGKWKRKRRRGEEVGKGMAPESWLLPSYEMEKGEREYKEREGK